MSASRMAHHGPPPRAPRAAICDWDLGLRLVYHGTTGSRVHGWYLVARFVHCGVRHGNLVAALPFQAVYSTRTELVKVSWTFSWRQSGGNLEAIWRQRQRAAVATPCARVASGGGPRRSHRRLQYADMSPAQGDVSPSIRGLVRPSGPRCAWSPSGRLRQEP